MDFFKQQEIARRKTAFLLVYFVLAVLFVIIIFNLMFFAIYSVSTPGADYAAELKYWLTHIYWEHPTAAIVLIIFYGSAWRHVQLIDGGKAVAALLGATPVNMQSRDESIKRYINVVEEITIASGVPAPTLYVLSRDKSINAFVAGYLPTESVMVVTRGALAKLTRDELQGVVAHEFSHILNGDMRLNMRLVVILAGVFAVFRLGRYFTQDAEPGQVGRKIFPVFWILGPVLYVIGYAGTLAGHLIKAAVSRQREYLADASAVQYTRNPQGIAGALYKIREQDTTALKNYHAEDMSHFWFSSTLERHLESLLSSHPPLEKRIAIIDTSFLAVQRCKEITAQQIVPPTSGEPVALTQPVSAMAGNVLPGHMAYAAEIYRTFSPELMAAVHSPNHVMAVIYGLLLLRTDAQRHFPQKDDVVMKLALQLQQQLNQLDRRHRLPLLDLALPILQNMDAAKKQELLQVLHVHITSASEFDLFEFVLISIIKQHLRPESGCDEIIKFHSLKPLMFDVQLILSLLAKAGGRADEAEALYQRNMAVFFPASNLPYFNSLMDYERLTEALDNLRHTSLPNRKLLIDVCSDMARHDGIIMPEEFELIRAIAECLDCPMPPLLAA